MAGVTDTGFIPKIYLDIIEENRQTANSPQFFGEGFPSTPDSVFGNINGVLSGQTVDLWNLGQMIAVQQNVDTATGIYLDYLGALVGVSRNLATGSTGKVLFYGTEAYTVVAGKQVIDNNRNSVSTDAALALDPNNCYGTKYTPNIITDFTAYTVTIESINYTYVSGGAATIEEIVTSLRNVINNTSNFASAVTEEDDTILVVEGDNELNNLTFTNSPNLDLTAVGSLIDSTADITGAQSFPANSLTELAVADANISFVNNPSAFTLGTDLETDEAYRQRIKTRQQTTGTATKPAIEASMLDVDGVTAAYVLENTTLETVNGVPPKSYETFVTGGDDDNIARELWRSKPAGINTFGNITIVIEDENGEEQGVSFSRPQELFAWMEVTYTLNPEETFPINGDEALKEAVVSRGNLMYAGEDYERTKFYGALYMVPGHYITNIRIAVTQFLLEPPVYQTATIPIPVTASLGFDTSRVTTVQV